MPDRLRLFLNQEAMMLFLPSPLGLGCHHFGCQAFLTGLLLPLASSDWQTTILLPTLPYVSLAYIL